MRRRENHDEIDRFIQGQERFLSTRKENEILMATQSEMFALHTESCHKYAIWGFLFARLWFRVSILTLKAWNHPQPATGAGKSSLTISCHFPKAFCPDPPWNWEKQNSSKAHLVCPRFLPSIKWFKKSGTLRVGCFQKIGVPNNHRFSY